MPERSTCFHHVSRRRFVKLAASMAGIIAFPTLLGAQERSSTAARTRMGVSAPMTIGVVVPNSTVHPTMGSSFLDGMRLFAHQDDVRLSNRPLSFIPAMYGTRLSLARTRIRDLIVDEHVNMIIGLMSIEAVAGLGGMFETYEVPLVVAGAGMNVVRAGVSNPSLVASTLGGWQSAMALGHWAGGHLGDYALTTASFYESGYDALYAFQLGFEGAGGRVTSMPVVQGSDFGMMQVIDFIEQTQPDVVYASYCGQQAIDFVRAYARAGLSRRIPLLGSSFLVNEEVLSEQGAAALGIMSVQAWVPGLQTAENRAFVAAYQSFVGCPANSFAALGYDTAQFIDALLVASSERHEGRDVPTSGFSHGVRGTIRWDQVSHEMVGPLYLCEVQGDTIPRNVVREELMRIATSDQRVVALRAGTKTGWLNGYLCV